MRRSLWIAAVAALALPACWYSTTRPKPSSTGTNGGLDPQTVEVTGLVQLFDRSDHHLRTMPGWTVQASLYVRNPRGGAPVFSTQQILQSGSDGVFRVRFTAADAAAVDLRGRSCDFDPDTQDCCLQEPPCAPSNCAIWATVSRVSVVPGQSTQGDVTVGCDHVP